MTKGLAKGPDQLIVVIVVVIAAVAVVVVAVIIVVVVYCCLRFIHVNFANWTILSHELWALLVTVSQVNYT